jgi:hypothetical protein
MAQPQAAPEPEETSNGSPEAKREASTIAFPYDDLDGAVQIARAIFDLHGSESEVEQIAAQIQQSPKSSGFRTQIASARLFLLITSDQGKLKLTRLGTQICDPQQERAAKAEAFLMVPLFKAVYDKFKGVVLPPNAGLENALVSLGVAPKQKERARQILQRSAQQAGFFQFGSDRLVAPPIKASALAPTLKPEEQPDEHEENDENKSPERQKKTKDSGGGEYHPFIQGLLTKLPPPDTDWLMEDRTKWLQAAIKIFDLMYTGGSDTRKSISVELKDSAK